MLIRVFGIDPALNGMAGDLDILLGHRQRLPRRDPDLLLNKVQIRHCLGHRMLHLDPGIHFHEIKFFIFIQKELNGPCILIMYGSCGLHRRLAHTLTKLF